MCGGRLRVKSKCRIYVTLVHVNENCFNTGGSKRVNYITVLAYFSCLREHNYKLKRLLEIPSVFCRCSSLILFMHSLDYHFFSSVHLFPVFFQFLFKFRYSNDIWTLFCCYLLSLALKGHILFWLITLPYFLLLFLFQQSDGGLHIFLRIWNSWFI